MGLFPRYNANMVACTVLVDNSRSMLTEIAPGWTRTQALTAGLDILATEMKDDPTVRNSVELSIIEVGGGSPHMPSLLQDWVYARDFSPPKLQPNGSTPLGAAVLMALDRTEKKKKLYRAEGRSHCRPWIIILSDGQPTDTAHKWAEAVQAARHAISGKHAMILSVGVDGCPLERLAELSSKQPLHLSSHRFSEFFVWLSASLGSTSQASSSIEQLASTDPWRG